MTRAAANQGGQRPDGLHSVEQQTQLRLSLSALMDDQADELEVRRVLRELPSNPELAATWRRYHAVRASLKHEIHRRPAVDLLAGIHAGLAMDNVRQSAPRRVPGIKLLAYFGQGAIAASVAVAALMSVSLLQTADDDPAEVMIAVDQHHTPELNGEYRASELARTANADDETLDLDRIERAVLQEFSGLSEPEEIPVSYNPDEFAFPPKAAEPR